MATGQWIHKETLLGPRPTRSLLSKRRGQSLSSISIQPIQHNQQSIQSIKSTSSIQTNNVKRRTFVKQSNATHQQFASKHLIATRCAFSVVCLSLRCSSSHVCKCSPFELSPCGCAATFSKQDQRYTRHHIKNTQHEHNCTTHTYY